MQALGDAYAWLRANPQMDINLEPETPFEDLVNDEIPWDPTPEPAWSDLTEDDIPF